MPKLIHLLLMAITFTLIVSLIVFVYMLMDITLKSNTGKPYIKSSTPIEKIKEGIVIKNLERINYEKKN